MDIKDYQKRAYVAIQSHDNLKDEVLNWAVGLAEEIGEVMGQVKHNYWGNESVTMEEIAKEIGDVLWYTSALCTALELDMSVVAELNIAKLDHRFGKDFSSTASALRHEKEKQFSQTDVYKQLIAALPLKGE